MKKTILWCFLISLIVLPKSFAASQGSFAIVGESFLLNGKPFVIHSGEIHYPRIPHQYWRERLHTVHALGLNTICTYIFWNVHEPAQGMWDFSGDNNLVEFIRLAQQEGLFVLVRPGPYVCSEWDFGGLPAWLLQDPEIRVRCMNSHYLSAVKSYINRIGKELAPLQINHGGPIIMVQVENEYGSYGNDTAYTRTLAGYYREAGFTVPFYTADGPDRGLLEAGTIPNVAPVVNFGSGAQQAFRELASYRPGVPPMCGEYWCGWFTHWGDSAWGKADTKSQLEEIRWMVGSGKSFNLYMVHGGTNFGWMAGANFTSTYEPDVTSYDYDAPVDETGRPRQKYYAIQEILSPGINSPSPTHEMIEIDSIHLRESGSLLENLPEAVHSPQVYGMEHFGQSYGYIMYRTTLVGQKSGTLTLTEPHDIAVVMLDGKTIGTLDRRLGQTSIALPETHSDCPRLDILVEAFGRTNFGPHLIDRKGITDRVTLNGITLMNWNIFLLPCDAAYRRRIQFHQEGAVTGPAFYRGSILVNSIGDTFLDFTGWERGVVWVNGHNVGRFWSAGPQHRLYLPGVWLRKGENEIMVFTAEGKQNALLRGVREPDFPAN